MRRKSIPSTKCSTASDDTCGNGSNSRHTLALMFKEIKQVHAFALTHRFGLRVELVKVSFLHAISESLRRCATTLVHIGSGQMLSNEISRKLECPIDRSLQVRGTRFTGFAADDDIGAWFGIGKTSAGSQIVFGPVVDRKNEQPEALSG